MISTSLNSEKNALGLEPMQIDAAQYKPLSQRKNDRRRQEGLCFYCGSSKHNLLECPIKPNGIEGSKCNFNGEWNIRKRGCLVTVGTMRLNTTKSKEKDFFISLDPMPCFIFPIHIKILDCEFSNKAFLDIGASVCFMDKDIVLKHSLELIRKAQTTTVEVIDG